VPGRAVRPTAASPAAGPGDQRVEASRAVTVLLALAVALAVAPMAGAALRAVAQGWRPTGDDAFIAIRSHDVFSLHPPLVGPWSSASTWSHRDVALPGPMQDYLLAVPVRVLGMNAGVAIGMAILNSVAVVGIAWLTRRRLGRVWAIVAMLFTASLAWSLGGGMLFDPWQPHAAVFAFALFLFAVWSIAERDRVGLPIAAATGTYLLQTHPSHVVLVPLLVVVSVAAGWRAIRHGAASWLWGSAAIVAVCWLPPVVQQLTTSPGNVTGLLHAARTGTAHPTLALALRVIGSGVALPPFWLPPSWQPSDVRLDDAWIAIGALVVLTAAVVALAGVTARRSDRPSTTLLALGASGLVGAVATAWHAPLGPSFNVAYIRWMWPLAMFVWFGVVVSVARLLAPSAVPRLERLAWRREAALGVGLASAAALVAFAMATVVDTPYVTTTSGWGAAARHALAVEARPRLRTHHDELVVLADLSISSLVVTPAFMKELVADSIPFRVATSSAALTLGSHRRVHPGEPATALHVTGVPTPRRSTRRIAAFRRISAEQARTLARLTREVRASLAGRSEVTLTAAGHHVIATEPVLRRAWTSVEPIRAHPDALVSSLPFAELVVADAGADGLVDAGPVRRGDLLRWARLDIRQRQRETFLDAGPFS
jgi:hypothetical protein